MILIRRFWFLCSGEEESKQNTWDGDVVTRNAEFYSRKRGRRLQVESLPGGIEVLCAEKKERIFIVDHFYIVLNLEVGRRPGSFPVSNGLPARGQGENLGRPSAQLMLILRYSKSMQEEISTLI
jgi:hypothetical protein